MKILILNVDRDDDFGRKVDIKSPIIGREENLRAAEKLALEDPEDSDVNSLFAAISLYDKLREEGRDVEIATVCGDISVGLKSDEKIANELDYVLEKTRANEVILVTDGAEDEYILPIIESRVKIRSVKMVTVKQSSTVESTYYKIVKMMEDDRIKKHFLAPVALILIIWSIFAFLDMARAGLSAIIFTLGVYLLIRAMKWESSLNLVWREIRAGILTGKVSIYTTGVAILILVASLFYAYTQTSSPSSPAIPTVWHFFVVFTKNVIWGLVVSGILIVGGRAIDTKVRKGNPWKYWLAPFSLLSFGFIGNGTLEILYDILYGPSVDPLYILASDSSILINLVIGILMATVGGLSYHYIKEKFMVEVEEVV